MDGSTTTCFLLLSWGALTNLVRTNDPVDGPLVHTTVGAVRGFSQRLRGTVVNTFIGIRYGKAPTGELRFREPQPAEPWNGVLNATGTPPACIQTNVYLRVEWAVPDEAEQSEDCLFLNVWSPDAPPSTSNLTVMVWIHGGGFHQGSSSLPVYDGAFLAAYGHVVVVSMNYRLGSLGFLHGSTQSAPGNQGHLDQALALRWVQDNIAKNPWYGMTHFDDVQYVFGRPLLENRSSDDQTYSKKLIELWTSFAKKGKTPDFSVHSPNLKTKNGVSSRENALFRDVIWSFVCAK
ncbi:hypothetical protein HPB47_016180 [Ixodes persulcatus]|uniref:Uncharacterized protein n=1 Tax=Ixodes persulcatus TaxID=34615 RepID=A0AC60QTJ9_IXOPE|nr:hypothetical protein HPB47_016180 [Ixodes persulcatus]